MNLGIASFLGGLGAGGVKGYMMAKDQERQDKKDKRDDEEFGWKKADRERADSERTNLAAAAAPVQATQANDVQLDDDGNQMPLQGVGQFRANGQRFDTMDAANTAATAANTPAARGERMAAALEGTGNYKDAMALRTGAKQDKMLDLQLTKAEEEHLNQKFNDSILAGGPEGAAKMISGSPLVGGQQVVLNKTADGKMQFATIGADGSQTMLKKPFDAKDFGTVAMDFMKGVTAPQRIQFMHNQAMMEQQAAQLAETTNHNRNTEKLQGQQIAATAGNAAATNRLGYATLAQREHEFSATLKNDPMYNMPPGVKLSVNGLTEEMKGLSIAMSKEPDGPGAAKLGERYAILAGQKNKLLAPYLGAATAAGGKTDSAGVRATLAGQGQPAPAAAPAAGGMATAGMAPAAAAPRPPSQATAAALSGNSVQNRNLSTMAAGAPAAPQAPVQVQAQQAYDSAKADLEAAQASVQKWGAAEKTKNPAGYRAAQKKVEQAQALLQEASDEYQQTLPPVE